MLFELTFQSVGLKENASSRRIVIKMRRTKKNILDISEETIGFTRVSLSQVTED